MGRGGASLFERALAALWETFQFPNLPPHVRGAAPYHPGFESDSMAAILFNN